MSEPSVEPRSAPEAKQCPCGTTRGHQHALPEREYSFFGTLYLLWGGTAVPTRVQFRCVHCGVVFDESTAPSVLKKHVL